MAHAYDIIIDRGAGEPGHGWKILDCLNATEKVFIYTLMENVQLAGSKRYDDQMEIHNTTPNEDIGPEK